LAALLLAHTSLLAAAEAPPSTRLTGATVPRAKALSLDAALARGWQLRDSGPDYAVFETPLDEPASTGPPDARRSERTHLRIRALFSAKDDGVEVSLRAEEVWRTETPKEWSAEITDRYRDPLQRALQSLNAQWRHFVGSGSGSGSGLGSGSDSDSMGAGEGLASATSKQRSTAPQTRAERASDQVGLWAFDAERLARAQGCALDNRGAVLVAHTPTSELHQVGCLSRPSLMIRCDRLRCWLER
jgi:hypothetical protein